VQQVAENPCEDLFRRKIGSDLGIFPIFPIWVGFQLLRFRASSVLCNDMGPSLHKPRNVGPVETVVGCVLSAVLLIAATAAVVQKVSPLRLFGLAGALLLAVSSHNPEQARIK
jgi:hypothetical protein